MREEERDENSKALTVAAFKHHQEKQNAIDHLEELALLADTSGIEIVHQEAVHVRQFNASTFISQGKLEELIELSKELQVNLIIFDNDISPAQQRNLEQAFKLTVMDRTEVILEVFAQRARTREAQLQIELASVKYQFPRLKRLWTHLSRQKATAGGGAYLKGEGEKQLEIDKRLLQRQVEQLEKELKEVEQHRETQRAARERSHIPIFALVGYTNAGKSSLLNALTDAEVFVEDKLFATLDTTTRKMSLSDGQEVLLIDTVGFIRKLPHQLVAAFKSTLEEAVKVDFLIHVIDVSNPHALDHAETTLRVVRELNSGDKPIITILNKTDICEDPSMISRLKLKYPKCVPMSIKNHEGFEELEETMIRELANHSRRMRLKIPQSEFHVVTEVQRCGHIINQEYVENDILIEADLSNEIAGKFSPYEFKSS